MIRSLATRAIVAFWGIFVAARAAFATMRTLTDGRHRTPSRISTVCGLVMAGLVMSIPARAAVTPPTQPYLMAFHTCASGATDCNSPANHVVQLAQSADGRTWSLVGGWQSYAGSVPDVFRRGNTLYIYSTSGLMRIDMTTGATTTASVTLSDGTYVDPSIAQLSDGRLILFYLPGIPGQDPAQCASGASSCVRQIKSAVEVAGSDGTQFTVDAGARISETITSGTFSDPDIFYNGSEWVVYVSRGSSVHAYSSSSIQGSYVFRGIVSNNLGGVPSAMPLSDGSIATYVHSSSGSSTEIRMGTSTSGVASIASFQTVLTAQSLGLGTRAESPGVALNVAGTSCPTCSSSTTTGVPGAPTNLQASVSGTTVSLQWSAPATGGTVSDYILEAGSATGQSNLFNASVGSGRSLSSPVANGTYFVRVRGRNASGTGTASNEVSFTVGSLSAPGAPSGLSATTNGTLLTLQWTAPSSGGAVGDYVLEAGRSSGGTDLFNGSVGTGTTISSQVTPGTYFLRVRARNAAGTSAASNEAQATVASPAPPGAPSALTASATGTVLSVRWSAPATGGTVADYVLEAGRTSGAADLYNASVGTATSLSAPVAPGTYFLRARARNAAGTGPASNEAQVVVGGCTAPSAPTGVTGSLSAGVVKVQWSAVTGATSYVLRAGPTAGTSTLFNGNVGADTVVTAAVATGFSAYIRVHAVNSCGESSASSEVWVR
jgi:hypothetical protein